MSKEKEYINFKEAVQLFLSRTIPELKSEEELPGINFIFSNDSFELFEYIKDNPYTKSNSWVPSLDYHDISNALPENNQNPSYPTIEIKNPIAFFELLTAITNAWLDLNNKYYGAVSGRALFISNIKRLWLRMSPNDFINVLEFLKRELKFLKTSFFEEFIKKEIAVGEYCNFKIYATKEINESWYETNEKITLKLVDDYGNIHSLPSIYYGIIDESGDKTCYIYAIQHESYFLKKRNKSIERQLYHLYKDVPDPQIHPSFLLSLTTFIDMLEYEGVYKIKVTLLQYLSYRYHELLSKNAKINFFKEWNEESLKRLEYLGDLDKEYKLKKFEHDKIWYSHVVDKEEFISQTKTENLLNAFYLLENKFNNVTITTSPFIEDEYLNIKVKESSKLIKKM